MIHRLYLLIAAKFEQAATYDEAWRQKLAQRGISLTIGLSGPAQTLAYCVIMSIAMSPGIVLIYLSTIFKSDRLAAAAAIYTLSLLLIVCGAIVILLVRNIRQYFRRRKMIKNYAAAHPNR